MQAVAHLPAPHARATRPDAQCFTALADAFEWIDQLLHIPLREPQQDSTEPYLEVVEGAELYAPTRLQPQVTALCDAGEDAVSTAMQITAPPARCLHVHAQSMPCAIGCSKRVLM